MTEDSNWRILPRREWLAALAGGLLISGGLSRAVLAADRPAAVPVRGAVLLEWSHSAAGSAVVRPRLTINSDGLVETWSDVDGVKKTEQRDPEQVFEFVRRIGRSLSEYNLTTATLAGDLREESNRLGLSAAIRGADDSILAVHLDGGRTEVRCPAAGLLAERFPDLSALQRFVDVERQVMNLHAVVQCGGQREAERLCEKANACLASEHPEAARWTIAELLMARSGRDGSRIIQFRRPRAADERGPGEFWTTSIIEVPGQPSQVSTLPPVSLLR